MRRTCDVVTAAADVVDWREAVDFWTLTGPADECHPWNGPLTAGGYGYVRLDGRQYLAHRLAFAIRYGYVPDGRVVDHLCANKWCVNPDHLEAVTNGENVRRGGRPHFEAVG